MLVDLEIWCEEQVRSVAESEDWRGAWWFEEKEQSMRQLSTEWEKVHLNGEIH